VVIQRVVDPDELRQRTQDLLSNRRDSNAALWLNPPLSPGENNCWFAIGPKNETLAIAVATVDQEAAQLTCMVSANRDGRSTARYLLSASVFGELAERGVRYVLADRSTYLPSGLVYFQKVVGFEPANLRLLPRRRRWWHFDLPVRHITRKLAG
jgi:hypothetical protein